MLSAKRYSPALLRSVRSALRSRVGADEGVVELASRPVCWNKTNFPDISPAVQKRQPLATGRSLFGIHSCTQTRNYAISTHAAKTKVPQCPTCGAAFQTERVGAPGYLNDQKWRQMNQANLVQGLPTIEGATLGESTVIPALAEHGAGDVVDKGSEPKVLSDEEYQNAIKNLDDPDLRAIFSGEAMPGFVDPNNMVAEPMVEDPEAGAEKNSKKAEPHSAIVASRLKRRAEQGRDRIVCQRCYKLMHHNQIDNPWKQDIVSDPRSLKFMRYRTNLLAVVVCDIFDLPGSLIPNLGEFIGERHPVILVANKADLLPKDYHQERNLGTRELAADITERRRAGQDIYMVGRANVGKSELINALLRISMGGYKHKVLASHVPGTTMGLSALVPVEGARPQDRQANLYDTPGVFSNKSLLSFLNNNELKMAMCSKRITPFTYILNHGQSIMLGGLGRIDLVDGPEYVYVTVFSNIHPHFTRTQRAVELTERLEAGEKTFLQQTGSGAHIRGDS
ncbi:hypothetical protein BX661DRAFT_177061 [Kickxella alabastrina]|uniref:uncharacterized protein n=1 Tax=Kickxella alabastrina TaxID=61397 RepID=UPI00221E9109|nr:uncharacterized protein BX661DRAFT_177061 [Kickxella alabastrina]KAI7834350.1 hypothetical protein BX661DRAFT_177061 [Kickxella alabastrina]